MRKSSLQRFAPSPVTPFRIGWAEEEKSKYDHEYRPRHRNLLGAK